MDRLEFLAVLIAAIVLSAVGFFLEGAIPYVVGMLPLWTQPFAAFGLVFGLLFGLLLTGLILEAKQKKNRNQTS